MNEFENYERFPVQIHSQNIMLVHIFKNQGFKMVWEMDEHQEISEYDHNELYDNAAEQFFKQLEGTYCDRFVQALMLKCAKVLKKRQDEIKRPRLDEVLEKINKL